jgi:hypothetical protein
MERSLTLASPKSTYSEYSVNQIKSLQGISNKGGRYNYVGEGFPEAPKLGQQEQLG